MQAKESDKIWLSTIQHADLINVKLIDNWNVYTCIHCKTVTHAEANDSMKYLMNPTQLVCPRQNLLLNWRMNDERWCSSIYFHSIVTNSDESGETQYDQK